MTSVYISLTLFLFTESDLPCEEVTSTTDGIEDCLEENVEHSNVTSDSAVILICVGSYLILFITPLLL